MASPWELESGTGVWDLESGTGVWELESGFPTSIIRTPLYIRPVKDKKRAINFKSGPQSRNIVLELIPQALASSNPIVFGGTATLTGIGYISSSGAITLTGLPALKGIGQLSSSGTLSFAGAAALRATGYVASPNTVTFGGLGTLTGSAGLSSGNTVTFGGQGTLQGTQHLLSASTTTFAGNPVLTGVAHIVSANPITFGGTASLVSVIIPQTRPPLFVQRRRRKRIQDLAIQPNLVLSLTSQVLASAGAITFGGTPILTGKGSIASSNPVSFGGQGTLINGATSQPPIFRTPLQVTRAKRLRRRPVYTPTNSTAILPVSLSMSSPNTITFGGTATLTDASPAMFITVTTGEVRKRARRYVAVQGYNIALRGIPSSTLSSANTVTFTGTPTLGGLQKVLSTNPVTFGGQGTLTAKVHIASAGSITFTGGANLSNLLGGLASANNVTFSGTGLLSGALHLSSSGSTTFAGVSVLTGIAKLQSANTMAFGGQGTLTIPEPGEMLSSGGVVFGGSAILTGKLHLASSNTVAFTGTPVLGKTGNLTGSSVGNSGIIGKVLYSTSKDGSATTVRRSGNRGKNKIPAKPRMPKYVPRQYPIIEHGHISWGFVDATSMSMVGNASGIAKYNKVEIKPEIPAILKAPVKVKVEPKPEVSPEPKVAKAPEKVSGTILRLIQRITGTDPKVVQTNTVIIPKLGYASSDSAIIASVRGVAKLNEPEILEDDDEEAFIINVLLE